MSMPSYWFDPMAGGVLGGNAATGQPAMSSAQINASMGWNPAAQAQATNIYGPQGFGGLTNQYSAAGAAYGRATGGFGGYGAANADPFTAVGGQADRIRAIYGAGALGGIGSDAARAPNQPPMSSTFDQSTYAPATNSMSDYFTRLTGGQQPNPVSSNPGYDYFSGSTYGLGSSGRAPTMPNSMRLLGYDPATSGQFAPNTNAYRPLGGAMQFPNSGTPSQYAPGAQMPPGFSQPYGAGDEGGALPVRPGLNWYGQSNSSS